MAERFFAMIPRDFITPSATILGLIFTALGILATLVGQSQQVIVKNFAFLAIIVVILFVLAVILTVLSSLLKKARFWSAVLVIYVVGWSVLGAILIIIIIGYVYGIEALQIQMPEFNFDLVSVILAIVGVISAAVSRAR